jgi:transposase, IS30 family
MSYTHFTVSERLQLYKLRITEQRSISEIMNRNKSSISRELKRNTDKEKEVYLPDTAQEKMKARRQESKERFKSVVTATIEHINERLSQYHSPEQIAGRMK